MYYTKHTRNVWQTTRFQTLLMVSRHLRMTCISILCLGLLAACSSSDDNVPSGQAVPNGLEPLTAEQIKTAFTGNSIYTENMNEAGQSANAILYHENSGKIRMRAWGHWGKLTDKGVRDVSDAGDYCAKWNGMLAARGKICFKIYKKGDQVFLVPHNAQGKRRTGTLLPGNYLDS